MGDVRGIPSFDKPGRAPCQVRNPDFCRLPGRDSASPMADYGQFCSVARAHEAIGGRWTLLVVRELLCGSRRFNDIRRGIPRISRTMLSERLQELIHIGAVVRVEGEHGP